MMMEPAAPWLTLMLLAAYAAFGLWLNVRVLRKAGLSPWWSILFLFPVFWVVGVWIFAFVRWPRLQPNLAGHPAGGAGEGQFTTAAKDQSRPPPYVAPDPRSRHSWDNDRQR